MKIKENQLLNSFSDGKSEPGCEHPSSREEVGLRLSAVIEAYGTRQKAAEVADRSTDMLTKYIKGVVEPPFLPLARLCAGAEVRMEWLASGKGPQGLPEAPVGGSASQDLSVGHLTIAIELADEALRGLWLPRSGYAELVALVYNALMQGLPYAAILDIARPAAKQRARQGASDDSEQGMDRSGPEGIGCSAAG